MCSSDLVLGARVGWYTLPIASALVVFVAIAVPWFLRVLAIDPGFRTGCKTVVLDAQGQVRDLSGVMTDITAATLTPSVLAQLEPEELPLEVVISASEADGCRVASVEPQTTTLPEELSAMA